ncbi:RNA editing comple protein MP63 [Leishmania infantum JPCM5]|uniref:RNA_editing_comple_protein_MP63 n=2 Tax=Leishmania infantum TaxID=5671 RepID=A0A6L0XTJ0_LEIIN|nr:RNA editing comple protein MP63 [Leishmania infantum JPCM5]CAC9553557.1 RNA_editing_comple_protein_MP63 [Leishmania infantum]CAM72510.1 RNA editing comple protein MP63 [Leishmania infantum JPCM5]SUZ47117.1 RNA_editing_comple_protein_MP63 [Leishmania infantum]|eukprot:XP_001469402.1 RNA editing comple protein MP63 [Leishmania infantum JPCM5]
MTMKRRIGVLAAAAASRCTLRRLPQVSSWPLHASGAVASAKGASNAALLGAVRNQSAVPDRRFHCSVCKKSFRLEMAAKLHLQQVHSGEGTVEAGAGPGQGEDQALQTPVGVFRNAPPQAPTVVTAIVPDTHERAARREKPAPKPLHQAEREVPSLVMEKMLSVWDDTGVKRMGDQFVHSSMVMRVFAARPSDGAEPLYGVMNPEGENPFEGGPYPPDAGGPLTKNEVNFYSIGIGDAFALACGESFGPLRPARCPNPFLRKLAKDAAKTAPRVGLAEQQTAPVTPFGQLPMFGQTPSPATTPAPSAAEEPSTTISVVSSPFAAGANDSPFAGTTDFPFAGQGLSPFGSLKKPADQAAAEPGIAARSAASFEAPASPFVDAASALTPSPFAAAPSPFTESSSAAAPYAARDAAAVAGGAEAHDAVFFSSFSASSASRPAEVGPTATHVCTVCKKSFSTYDGLRMHSKAKHGEELPKELRNGRRNEKREVPDLPAFIPSPVDLTMTSPFGSSAQRSAWTEVELKPYAQSVSNITVAGRVLDSEVSSDGALLLSLFVPDSSESESEVIPVRCSSAAFRTLGRTLVYGDLVFACGSLRVLPFTDKKTQKTYSSAVVHVGLPTGMIAKLN